MMQDLILSASEEERKKLSMAYWLGVRDGLEGSKKPAPTVEIKPVRFISPDANIISFHEYCRRMHDEKA